MMDSSLMFSISLITLLVRGIEGDKAVLGDDPMAAREGYSDCCGMLGITCWKDYSSCVASVY